MYRPYEPVYIIDKYCFHCKKLLEKEKHWFFACDHCFCSAKCRKYFILGNTHFLDINHH